MAKLSAIILGAGLSRRMGDDNKLFLPIKGKPMIEWVIEKVKNSRIDEIILVGSELSMNQLIRFEDSRMKIVENIHYLSGMTSSIQAGVKEATGDGYMICLGDQPTIEISTYDQLIVGFESTPHSIIIPYYGGRKGNPVVLPGKYRAAILTHSKPEGCKEIIQKNRDYVIEVATDDPGILMDVDTKEDYNILIDKK